MRDLRRGNDGFELKEKSAFLKLLDGLPIFYFLLTIFYCFLTTDCADFHRFIKKPLPRRHDGPGKGMMRQKFTDYLDWLEKNYPEKAEELKKLKEDNRQLYRKRVAHGMKKHRRIMEAEKENPELAKVLKESMELNQQRNKLAREIRTTEDEKEKQKLTKQLEGLLNEKFSLVLKRKELELQQLQKRLEQLKKQLKKNQENIEKWKDSKFKEQKIKERLERLTTGKKEEFRWD